MSKSTMKAELLKMLRDEMMDDDKDELMEEMMPKKKITATISADDKEGLLEGAKKLPEALSAAEKFMKARMGSKEDK